MNTFFQHRDVHKCTWCRDSLGQQSLIDICIVSADLYRSVLGVRVKRRAELSTDHHLLVCNLIASGKAAGAYTNVQDQVILPNKVGGPG